MDTRIYVMTHKEYVKPEDDMYISMHVGHALGNEFGYLADDTGDNISSKNRNYCELTGMYWLWKNVQCDIVGICHYRRYFVKNEDFITKQYIEEILKAYDLIIPNSGTTQYANNMEHYEKMHSKADMLMCREVVLEKYPEYIGAFDLCMNTNLASLANMVITRKEIFDEYCEWLFDVLFEVERRVDISEYDSFQARIFGYLSERLFRVWLLGKKYRIREEEVQMLNPAEAYNSRKYVNLTYRRVELLVSDLLHQYKNGNYVDLIDLNVEDINFDGKMPVFVCWWQGLEEMPELVKKCVESIDENIPRDISEVHLITLDNYEMYVKFPLWLVEKFKKGIISMTHMSDVLRMSLLYLYGGMWIDATFFVSGSMPREIFTEKDFYTLRFSENVWKSDVVQGRWANNWMRMQKGNVLARYVLNALCFYWFKTDDLIDYFLFDYLIATAYDNIPEVKGMIDSCEYSNPGAYRLVKEMNSLYSKDLYDDIFKDTYMFKLTHKLEFKKENLVGEKTIWGHIFEENK